jgi:hypothetical protein
MHQFAASQSALATRGRSNTLTRAQWAAEKDGNPLPLPPGSASASWMPPMSPRGAHDAEPSRLRTNSGAEAYGGGAGFAPIYDPTSTGTGAASKARKVRARDNSERAKELYLEVRVWVLVLVGYLSSASLRAGVPCASTRLALHGRSLSCPSHRQQATTAVDNLDTAVDGRMEAAITGVLGTIATALENSPERQRAYYRASLAPVLVKVAEPYLFHPTHLSISCCGGYSDHILSHYLTPCLASFNETGAQRRVRLRRDLRTHLAGDRGGPINPF